MASPQEARVPDIGDYDDVPVIEVLVAVGDTVSKDQGLVTLESDKATMEVPSPFAGVVRELKVKVGDKLSEGSVVARSIEGAAMHGAARERRHPDRRPRPQASRTTCDRRRPTAAGRATGGRKPRRAAASADDTAAACRKRESPTSATTATCR